MGRSVADMLISLGYSPERAAELDALSRARSEKRRRTSLVGVRLTPEEYAQATALADARGVTVPDLFRQLLQAADAH